MGITRDTAKATSSYNGARSKRSSRYDCWPGAYYQRSCSSTDKKKGVLATADKSGEVNLAMYARPYFIDGHTVTFIIGERLTHENLKSNPGAAYLFTEERKYFEEVVSLMGSGESA